MNFEIQDFTDTNIFWDSLSSDFSELSKNSDQPFNLAASGGSAANLFDHLTQKQLSNSNIFIADERFVPETDKDSNALLLKSKLLKSKLLKSQQLFTWETDRYNDINECAQSYAKRLPKQLDLILLGVGPDGHTVSLFPNGQWLEDYSKKCLVTYTDEFAVRDRLSLSFAEIKNAKNIWVLMIGKAKKQILDIITNEETDFKQYPARRVLDFGANIYYLNR